VPGEFEVGREHLDVEADDHVDPVARLDDRPDAADLVHLDGHAALGGRALDVEDLALEAAGQGARRDRGTGRDLLTGDLADDLRDVPERIDITAGDGLDLDFDLLRLDRRSERDVRDGDDRRELGRHFGRLRALTAAATLRDQQDADECDDREEHPDEQDESIRALQSLVSPSRDVTGGTTVAPRKCRATIPMG
jgi:hypothetical protein